MMFRYVKLFGSLARFSLLGEMAFRMNFLIKITVELAWLSLIMFFYSRLFDYTEGVAGWSKFQYFFFVGCFYILDSVIESLFLGNFGEFAELVRNGNLDLVLIRPVDEQFMVSCRRVEWSSVPNVAFGSALMTISVNQLGIAWDTWLFLAFVVAFVAAISMAYSFMLMLASTSIWLVRNQSLYELWWLFTSLMRYPREIYDAVSWGRPIGWFFTFVVPILLAVNVPAATVVKTFELKYLILLVAASVALLALSRWVFRRALRSYRSASS